MEILSELVTLIFVGALVYTIYSFFKGQHIKSDTEHAERVKRTKKGAIVTIVAFVLMGILGPMNGDDSSSSRHSRSTHHTETRSEKIAKSKKEQSKKNAKSLSKQQDKDAIQGFQKSVTEYVNNTSGDAPFTVKEVKFKDDTTVMIVVDKSSFDSANPDDIKTYFRTAKDHIDNLANMTDMTGDQLLIVDDNDDGLAGVSITGKVKIHQNL